MKDEKGAAHKARNNRGILIGVLVLVGLIVAGRLISSGGSPSPTGTGTGGQAEQAADEPDDRPTPTRTRAPEVTNTYSPHGTLVVAINEALGESNRDRTNNRKFTNLDYRETEGSISVTWAADDNFSSSLIVAGIEGDAADVLRAIDESGVDYERVFLAATFALQDAAGNAFEGEVMLASYDRATIERIDWDTFLRSEAFDIAGHYQISPVLSD